MSNENITAESPKASSNNEGQTTVKYGAVALGCLLVTGIFEWASRPAAIEEFGKVGKEFYPEFVDPTGASSLSVTAIDVDEMKPLEFSVKQLENKQWVIPSHHNYPADAADQLADTASSIIGIKRGAMVTRWAADHARYGVVDPQTDSLNVDEVDGVGKRLTLRDTDDSVLASFIIGKEVEDGENEFYVRHPDEDETYITNLDIDLSTKFSDWVKTDLLDVNSSDFVNVKLNDYKFDELRRAVTSAEETELTRESSTADWEMDGIKEGFEVNKDAIRDTVNTFGDMKLLGVRPRQAGLTSDLKLDRSIVTSQQKLDRLQADLRASGFVLQPDRSNPGSDKLMLLAREGETSAGTEKGVVYNLHFGRVFTGSQMELEIGGSSEEQDDKEEAKDKAKEDDEKKKKDESKDGETDKGDDEPSEEAADDKDEDDSAEESDSEKPGRYVFVRVLFDESLLGEAPQVPEKPEKSQELIDLEKKAAEAKENAEEDSESDSEPDESDDNDDEKEDGGEDGAEDSEAEDENGDEDKKEDRLEVLTKEYNAALTAYDNARADLEEFKTKVKEGREEAEKLNKRYESWYYVIDGADYDKLSLSRQDLISEKEKEEGSEDDADKSKKNSSNGPALNIPLPPETNETPKSDEASEGETPEMKKDDSNGEKEIEKVVEKETDKETEKGEANEKEPKKAEESSKPEDGDSSDKPKESTNQKSRLVRQTKRVV